MDDSAVARQALSAVLSSDPGLRVTVAGDPLIAIQKMKSSRPDVILLDLEMPRMNGLTFLRDLMERDPIPVVVCSSAVGDGTEAALRALKEGAVEVVAKPKLGVRDFFEESAMFLIDSVRAAAHAHLRPRRVGSVKIAPGENVPAGAERIKRPLTTISPTVVAMGASTGGTEALRAVLELLPPDSPGIVIVQHMPEGFTRSFAQQLDRACQIEVKEAADRDAVLTGRALIAPGNRQTRLVRKDASYAVGISDGPLVCRHRPSVDVLFRSVAQVAGPNAVGVILTGMGSDGADGLLAMRRAGAATIGQDEASCVVYGMPKEANARGGVQEVVPLSKIAAVVLQKVKGRTQPPR